MFQLSQTDEWFNIDEKSGVEILTNQSEVCTHMREAAQCLINAYVRSQGLNISQVIFRIIILMNMWFMILSFGLLFT